MSEWWQSLSLAQQVFYGIAVLASLVLVVQIVMTLIGADHGVDMDIDTGHHSSGLGILSVQSIAMFLAGLGWGGVIWLNRGFGVFVAILAGSVVGVVLMAASVFLMRWLMRLNASGTLDYNNAVGQPATAYCPIPPHGGHGGQVEVMIQGRLVFAEAVSHSAEPIKTGARVRVVSLQESSVLVVEPI